MTFARDGAHGPEPPRGLLLVLVAVLVPATACGPPAGPAGTAGDGEARGDSLEVRPVSSPAPEGARYPALASHEDRVALVWTEPGADAASVRVARGRPGPEGGWTWDPPSTVVQAPDLFVNWADFPGVAFLDRDTLAATWLQRSGESPYAYHAMTAFSRGAGWGPGRRLHEDASPTEHGFVSLAPLPENRLGAVWLDGRATGRGGPMQLRYREISPGGFGPERRLDERVCDCCQTSLAAFQDGGLLAAYRDRSDEEIRDVAVVHTTVDGWSPPRVPAADGWKIEGCPVNGPSVDALDGTAVLAWFTAAEPQPRIQAAFTDNRGASWVGPVRVDGGRPLGRVHARMLDRHRAVIAWLEATGEGGAEVRARIVTRDGDLGEPARLGRTSAARASGFPRLERTPPGILAAWTETGPPVRIRMALLSPAPR